MAKIFWSMAGEGRGHATRVRSIVEQLHEEVSDEHHFVLFASDQAYDFLAPCYADGSRTVEVRRIPGLRFRYREGRLSATKSLSGGLRYLRQLPGLVEHLKQAIRDKQPDLVITDFEPALPRAARACNVPFVSLDHQHFLVACDLSSLPTRLRGFAWLNSLAVRAYHSGASATIVSSFFQAPLKRGYEGVKQIGPLLRPEIRRAQSSRGDYLLSYLRPSTPAHVLDMLLASGREVRVYGLGERLAEGHLRFFPFDEQTFVDDLAGCAALVGAAGNQSLGEALFLGKPVLAMPERRHHEQLINAHFLAGMGVGEWMTMEQATTERLHQFCDRLEEYRGRLAGYRGHLDGNAAAIAEIRRFLPAMKEKTAPLEAKPEAAVGR